MENNTKGILLENSKFKQIKLSVLGRGNVGKSSLTYKYINYQMVVRVDLHKFASVESLFYFLFQEFTGGNGQTQTRDNELCHKSK